VDIYDAATFMLQQSLTTPGIVRKIQGSPDGSILFFAHSLSVTMWDVQTGGLIHTFATQHEISDMAVSPPGTHIACGLSDGSVTPWDAYTREEGEGFGNGQPIITICWLSPQELAVATQGTVYIHDFAVGGTLSSFSIPGSVWGMVYSRVDVVVDEGEGKGRDEGEDEGENKGKGEEEDEGEGKGMDDNKGDHKGEILVGYSQYDPWAERRSWYFLKITKPGRWRIPLLGQLSVYLPQGPGSPSTSSPALLRQLLRPTLIGKEAACITPPTGVQLFDTNAYDWTNNPPLLGAAISVAVSLNRNLVVQTKDSIQIFSINVLTSGKTHNNIHPSRIYPLGKNHIICLQPSRHLTLLGLETLQELRPGNDDASPLGSLLTDKLASAGVSFGCRFVAEFGVSAIMQAWRSGAPLPELAEASDEDTPLRGWSPKRTRVVEIHNSPEPELRVKDTAWGAILAKLPLEYDEFGMGEVYDLIFDSETRFHIKVDGPGWHIKIPHDIVAFSSGWYSHTIIKGKPVRVPEPRPTLPYTLDAGCEWVLDAESRKICWISPGDLQRGNGGHVWAGSSLVMVGSDGVVRKLTFKEPDC